MDKKADPAAVQRGLEALGKDKASALLLRDLTRQPGWLYLKQLGDNLVDQYEGYGLPKTEAEGYRFAMAGPIRKALKILWSVAERCGREPADEAEAALLKAIADGSAIIEHEVE